MATIRRLSDTDVRSIFESLHGDHPPPSHLKFRIVPVGPNGLKLSPPSFEFEDGLYVLLRPEKKVKNSSVTATFDPSKVPPHLFHLAMIDIPDDSCPWSLSGPQFPQPTAIQQRYCYPKGNPEYSGRKGGALWTMYGRDGKEDLEFRLLHVYFSAKRAVNKGMAVSKTQRAKHQSASTPQKKKRKTVHRSVRSPWQERKHQKQPPYPHYSPSSCQSARIYRTASPLPLLGMPTAFPPPSPCASRDTIENRQSIFVSPANTASSATDHRPQGDGIFDHPPFHPVPSFELTSNAGVAAIPTSSSSYRPQPAHQHLEHPYLELFRTRPEDSCRRGRVAEEDDEDDGFACHAMDGATLVDLDSYWNDPLFALVMKPSMDQDECPPRDTVTNPCKAFGRRLELLHERIREGILSHPPLDQGPMLSIVANWARSLAKSPLEIFPCEMQDSMDERPADKDTEAATAAV